MLSALIKVLSTLIKVLLTLIKVLLTFEDRYPNESSCWPWSRTWYYKSQEKWGDYCLGRTDRIKNEVLDSELGIIPISQEKWGDNGWFHFPKRLTSW